MNCNCFTKGTKATIAVAVSLCILLGSTPAPIPEAHANNAFWNAINELSENVAKYGRREMLSGWRWIGSDKNGVPAIAKADGTGVLKPNSSTSKFVQQFGAEGGPKVKASLQAVQATGQSRFHLLRRIGSWWWVLVVAAAHAAGVDEKLPDPAKMLARAGLLVGRQAAGAALRPQLVALHKNAQLDVTIATKKLTKTMVSYTKAVKEQKRLNKDFQDLVAAHEAVNGPITSKQKFDEFLKDPAHRGKYKEWNESMEKLKTAFEPISGDVEALMTAGWELEKREWQLGLKDNEPWWVVP